MPPLPRHSRPAFYLALTLLFTAWLRADPVISEFLAANSNVRADSDGQFSDWIELYNPDAGPVDLAGWFLTDDAKALTKWQFPAVTLPAGGYLVVYASDKNRRDPTKELHTNFSLETNGEYLALVRPDGKTVASEFAPKYPAQLENISYGITQPTAEGEKPVTGHFRTPTPGTRNGGLDTVLLLERVVFSRSPGPFSGSVSLTLSGAAAGQRIRYTVTPPSAAGAAPPEPTAAATEYTGPLTLSSSVVVSAAVFSADNRQRGFATAGHYSHLATTGASRLDTFSSQLPLLAIDTHGFGPLVKDGVERPGWIYAWNRAASGATTLNSPPDATSALTLNVRGSTSADFPKKGFTVRLNDGDGKDRAVPLLGLPGFDTWVLVGPWTYDPSYLHNAVIYALSNRMGRWAPRTQFAEVFLNTNGGDLDSADYAGIYLLTDALRVQNKRVDLASLAPEDVSGNAVTGGYLMKFDVPAPEDFSFQTKRNYPGLPSALIVTSPKAEDLPQAQRDYIRTYVQGFEDALYADTASGWKQRTYLDYIDRASWVDYHILNTLSMNADALVRSAYMTKDRRGKLVAGPAWDYDRALGGGDPRTLNPEMWAGGNGATEFWTYGWWGMLAKDPDFMQAWIDRWQSLRRTEFTTPTVGALIDGFATQIGTAAAARDAKRWPENTSRFASGWQGEVDNLKSFISRRSAWIDAKFIAPPGLTNANGNFVLTPTPGTQLVFTTDGSDPRASGGGVAAGATVANGVVTLPNTLNLRARSYVASVNAATIPGSPWSSVVTSPGRLINLSILTDLSAGDSFTMGFVVGGADTGGTKALLARAAGPSLVPLGVTNAHPDPKLELYAGTTKLRENDNWEGAEAISSVFTQVGAFAYVAPTSKDAAVFAPAVAAGNNSVAVSGAAGAAGTVIAELYDATPANAVGATTPRLINVSVLKQLGGGFTAGFVIGGGSDKNVLIRAVGPTLNTAFGVPGVVSDPQLTLFGANSLKIADNDDWGGGDALTKAFTNVGAFALPENARDAALLATLAPGSYTVQVTGGKSDQGLVLVEVYEVP